MARQIPLNGKYKDLFALVDDELYEELNQHKWCGMSTGYVVRYENGQTILMHRVIVCAPDGAQVDHANGCRTDNQRVNLRVCTHQQNMMNRQPHRSYKNETPASVYKGVRYEKDKKNPWCARITFNGKRHRLGSYENEIAAARAYDEASLRYFGEFAKTNFG